MRDTPGNLDQTGGTFDLDSLKKKYRRPGGASQPQNALAAIEREIFQEIASQAGRYGERLDTLLGKMAALRQTVQEGLEGLATEAPAEAARLVERVNTCVAQHNELRRQAQQVQHYLIIHREAMGFWNHDDVFRHYPIPAPLSLPSPTYTPEPPDRP